MVDMSLPHWLLFLIILPFSACIGSFMGVVIFRMPRHIPFVSGRSYCESCHRALPTWSMVPVLSFLVLRGRCHYCSAPIRREILAVELTTMVTSGLVAWLSPSLADLCFGLTLTCGLLVLGWIDAEHFYLPDVISLPLLLLGLLETGWLYPEALAQHALAAIIGYASLTILNIIYRALRHTDGIGQGDAKLLALAGAWIGWATLPDILAAGAMIGLMVVLYWRLTRRAELSATLRIPFGTCLAPAIFIAYLAQSAGLISR